MPGEFEKLRVNGDIIWKCKSCGEEILGGTKPRGHRCGDSDNADSSAVPSSVVYTNSQVPRPALSIHTTPSSLSTPMGPRANSVPRGFFRPRSQSQSVRGNRNPPRNIRQQQGNMDQMFQAFQQQSIQTQNHLESRLEEQRKKDEMMMDMMMKNQQLMMEQQNQQ